MPTHVLALAPLLQSSPSMLLSRLVSRTQARFRALGADSQGAMTTEYVLLVGTVGLVVIGGLVGVGPFLLASYERSRAILLGPFP